jgi:hypothetical protein
MSTRSAQFLRRVLAVDAISSAAMALMLLALTAPLASMLAVPSELLHNAGAVLLPFAMFVGWLATRPQPARGAVWIVIASNALWVIESAVILLGNWMQPNALGYVFVIGQALVVGLFAELQWLGLRKAAVIG